MPKLPFKHTFLTQSPPAEFQKAKPCFPSAPNFPKLLDGWIYWFCGGNGAPLSGSSLLSCPSSPLVILSIVSQSLLIPKPSATLPWAVGMLLRSPCFLLRLILTTLMSPATVLPCLLDTNKSPCRSVGIPFTDNKLCGSYYSLFFLYSNTNPGRGRWW